MAGASSTQAAIAAKEVSPEAIRIKAMAESIITEATAEKTRYLKAPSRLFFSFLNAIMMNDETAVISRKT